MSTTEQNSIADEVAEAIRATAQACRKAAEGNNAAGAQVWASAVKSLMEGVGAAGLKMRA